MPKKPPLTTAYSARRAKIQPFLDFRLPKKPSNADKSKARYYEKILFGRTVQDKVGNKEFIPGLFNPKYHVPVYIKGRKNRAILLASEGQDSHKHIVPVFVETVPDPTNPHGRLQRPKLKFSGGGVSKTVHGVTWRFFPFRTDLFFDDDSGEQLPLASDDGVSIQDVLTDEVQRILTANPDIDQWRLKCGRHQIQQPYTRDGILDKIKNILHSPTGSGDTISQWATGLVGLDYDTRTDLKEFVKVSKELRTGKFTPSETPTKKAPDHAIKKRSKSRRRR